MSKLKKALEKAKKARDNNDDISLINEETGNFPLAGIKQAINIPHVEHVTPVYEKVRVQKIDFELARKNRILTTCIGNVAADNIKILRTQLIHNIKESAENTLLIASANPGEGRTTAAINLSISLSQQIDRSVLLVEADLRNPSIHKVLGLDIKFGLSDYLRGKAEITDILINPGLPQLDILPAGKTLPNSSELLGSQRMQLLIKELKRHYSERFIIFDSPPILTCADALVLSRFIDSILMIVEAENTTKEELKRAVELLKDRHIIGTVLNKLK